MTNFELKPKKAPVMTKGAIQMRNWRAKYPDKRDNRYKIDLQKTKENRLRLMDVLGGRKCCECGYEKDVRALHIDHKNDSGYKDRYKFRSNLKMYIFYLKHPKIAIETLQVLCFNCNAIKQHDKQFWRVSKTDVTSRQKGKED